MDVAKIVAALIGMWARWRRRHYGRHDGTGRHRRRREGSNHDDDTDG